MFSCPFQILSSCPEFLAIKILQNKENVRESLRMELRAKGFEHQNVVRIFGEFKLSNPREIGLAMELGQGDLKTWRSLNPKRVWNQR